MGQQLNIDILADEAREFCKAQSCLNHNQLLGITDGKAVGTYIQNKFQQYLSSKYEITIGNSANGIDLPDKHINTDIKATSINQPQSSCPFKTARQKIYGLGYNLLIFVYEKIDNGAVCRLQFRYCTFVPDKKTADFSLSAQIIQAIGNGANKDDIIAILHDRNIPGDSIIYNQLADEILSCPPQQGYLTISNALQWRLQYSRVISLQNTINGIKNYEWQ